MKKSIAEKAEELAAESRKKASIERFEQISKQLKELKTEHEALKKSLLEQYGAEESYLKEDFGYAIELKISEQKRFDVESYKNSNPATYAEFLVTSKVKAFSVKKMTSLNG